MTRVSFEELVSLRAVARAAICVYESHYHFDKCNESSKQDSLIQLGALCHSLEQQRPHPLKRALR
jgi:hypothetical protein